MAIGNYFGSNFSTPNWMGQPMLDLNPTFNFVWPSSTTPSGQEPSYASETPAERDARKIKEVEEKIKEINTLVSKKSEVRNQLEELQKNEEYKELNTLINVQNGQEQEGYTKNSDGSIAKVESLEDYKKRPWWQRALKAVSNMGQGVWKLATDFVGYEEGGMNWGKCLKNIGIAAGCIALTCIPVVGPVITAGLLAGGVVAGGVGVYKGIKKLDNATSVEELDKGWQEIGSGSAIGIASAVGLKGLGRSAAGASTNIFKNMTVDAFNATKQGVMTSKATVAQNGFFKTWGTNTKNAAMAFKPKSAKQRFAEAKQGAVDSMNARISEIDGKLANNALSSVDKQLLTAEKNALKSQITELNSASTRSGWSKLSKESVTHQRSASLKETIGNFNGRIEIGGRTYFVNRQQYTSVLEEIAKRNKTLAEQIESLVKLRQSTMRSLAIRPFKNGSELQAYTGKTSNLRAAVDAVKPNTTVWGTVKATPKAGLKLGWNAMSLPFKPYSYVKSKNPVALGGFRLAEVYSPTYESDLLKSFGFLTGDRTYTPEMIAQAQAQLAELGTESQYRDAIAEIDKEIKALST